MSSFRLDRIITTGLVHPVIRLKARFPHLKPSRCLPILMYHSISVESEGGVAPYFRTVTSPGRFAGHMRFLRDQGWRGVSLREGLRGFQQPMPGNQAQRPVVITFDDGFRDFYTNAFPILKECGFTATMYLPTAFIGDEPLPFNGRDCLTWNEVREMAGAGIEFGSHTIHHPKLIDLPWGSIETELRGSKSLIEQKLGLPATAFAYPFAFPQANVRFADRFREALEVAGYQSCVTTEIGRATASDDLLRLKRLPVNDADDLQLLLAKVDGAYDWLAWPQAISKRIKHTGSSNSSTA